MALQVCVRSVSPITLTSLLSPYERTSFLIITLCSKETRGYACCRFTLLVQRSTDLLCSSNVPLLRLPGTAAGGPKPPACTGESLDSKTVQAPPEATLFNPWHFWLPSLPQAKLSLTSNVGIERTELGGSHHSMICISNFSKPIKCDAAYIRIRVVH